MAMKQPPCLGYAEVRDSLQVIEKLPGIYRLLCEATVDESLESNLRMSCFSAAVIVGAVSQLASMDTEQVAGFVRSIGLLPSVLLVGSEIGQAAVDGERLSFQLHRIDWERTQAEMLEALGFVPQTAGGAS